MKLASKSDHKSLLDLMASLGLKIGLGGREDEDIVRRLTLESVGDDTIKNIICNIKTPVARELLQPTESGKKKLDMSLERAKTNDYLVHVVL